MAPPKVIRQTVRRHSRGCWPDFVQRVRLGLIGAAFILIIAGVLKWI